MKKLLLLTIALFTLSGAWADYQKLYVIGDGIKKAEGNAWDPTNLVEMTYNSTTQTYTYEYTPTAAENYFAIADEQQTTLNWGDFNANHRYYIDPNKFVPELGAEYSLTKGEGSIVLPKGTYTISVKDMKITVTGTIDQRTVTFVNDENWDNVYVHAWNGEGNITSWPGEKLTNNGDNTYTWNTTSEPTGLLFHNNAGTQTEDLVFVDGATYNSSSETKNTVSFKNSIGWENVYAYTYSPETLGGWHGTKMDEDGDVYTISFFAATPPAKIIFNDGVGNVVGESQTANLDFVDGKTYDMVSPGYYIVGNMTSWELNKDYKMTKNESADADEYMKIAMPLENGNQFKVVSTEDGSNITTWYPGGETPNYTIAEDGTYDIYFRPEEKAGWFENYIYVAQEISIDITKNLWASYSSTKALDFSNSGLTAYIATTSNGSSVHYEPVTYVPANTGVILYGTKGTHVAVTIPSADAVGTNLLVSTANEEHTVTAGEVGKVYAFGMKGGKVGFVQAEEDYTVAQGKSYLDLSTVGAKGIDFIGLPGSETDGIDTIHNAQFIMHNDAYNLAGQKVNKDYKGIVIVNGKKYLNK